MIVKSTGDENGEKCVISVDNKFNKEKERVFSDVIKKWNKKVIPEFK